MFFRCLSNMCSDYKNKPSRTMTHECPLCLEEKDERLLNFHLSLHDEQDHDTSKAEHACCVACWNAYMTSVRSKSFSSSPHQHHLVTCPFCRQIVFVLYVEKEQDDEDGTTPPSCHWQDAIVFFLSGFAMLLCTAGCV